MRKRIYIPRLKNIKLNFFKNALFYLHSTDFRYLIIFIYFYIKDFCDTSNNHMVIFFLLMKIIKSNKLL